MATRTETPETDRYDQMTQEELYELAQKRDIDGRSQMEKDELAEALRLEDTGPDAVDLIRSQHRRIEDLFEQFDELSDRPSKKKEELVTEIITVLVKHSEVEEQILYPEARDELDLEDDIEESLEEHHVAELLLWELDKLSSDHERYDAKVTVLKENVLHHIEEEESDVLPKLSKLSEQRRRELGGLMEKAWTAAPTRPHPLSPSTPPGNVLASIPANLMDLTVSGARLVRHKLLKR